MYVLERVRKRERDLAKRKKITNIILLPKLEKP